mmetsp:Transcript_18749/g.21553  ORF Transcript_18749/g.21553 Transcript_18749/m.21553 type:complete len:128 (-) Transcript_18749:77-460(-)
MTLWSISTKRFQNKHLRNIRGDIRCPQTNKSVDFKKRLKNKRSKYRNFFSRRRNKSRHSKRQTDLLIKENISSSLHLNQVEDLKQFDLESVIFDPNETNVQTAKASNMNSKAMKGVKKDWNNILNMK